MKAKLVKENNLFKPKEIQEINQNLLRLTIEERDNVLSSLALNGKLKLLNKISNFNIFSQKGMDTALVSAAQVGYTEICKILIEKGADVNKFVPLSWALKNDKFETAKFLISKGANADYISNKMRRKIRRTKLVNEIYTPRDFRRGDDVKTGILGIDFPSDFRLKALIIKKLVRIKYQIEDESLKRQLSEIINLLDR